MREMSERRIWRAQQLTPFACSHDKRVSMVANTYNTLPFFVKPQARQLNGMLMKKSKADEGRKEKQTKSMIRIDAAPTPVNMPIKKKKTKTSKALVSSGVPLASAEGDVDPALDQAEGTGEPARDQVMETISLGNKRPEGITRGPDNYMYVTEMLFGGVKKVNVLTGEVEQVVPSYGFRERGAYGIVQYENALFVAGGGVSDGTPLMVYVYDAEKGKEIAACAPEGDDWYLLNGIAILGDYVFVTDSFCNKLLVMDIAAALKGTCNVFSIRTPSEYFLADPPESFPRANGECPDGKQLLRDYLYQQFFKDLAHRALT